MSRSSLNLIDLDVNLIKSNLKNYMRSQSRFKDYDFEGSNLAALIELMAANGFRHAFYDNMMFSEGFLDSAQLRGSVISHAKDLNYTPRSAKSSRARVLVDFTASGETQPYIVRKGETFSCIVKNTNYVFSVPETLVVSSANTTFSFETDLYEGIYVRDTYVFDQQGTEIPRFKITNKNVDLDSLTVAVYEDGSVEADIYTVSRTLLGLNYASKNFFVQCNENEYYEVFFGDGVLGKKPKQYSSIVLDYRISAGPAADGAKSFAMNFNPTGQNSELITSPTVSTLAISRGGADVEDIESIRYYAPRSFQVQERTITSNDYEIALKTEFPEINAVTAYGGELLSPPQYGRVFVAVDIANVDGLPESKKQEYYNFLKKRAPFSIEPVFVLPDYSYLSLTGTIRYNINQTRSSKETFNTLITNTIIQHRNDQLNDFAVTFRPSVLTSEILDLDPAIVSAIMDITLYKKVQVQTDVLQSMVVDFGMPLSTEFMQKKSDIHRSDLFQVFQTSIFTYRNELCRLEDDGAGTVNLVKVTGDMNTKIATVGSINYETGQISVEGWIVNGYFGDSIKFFVRPRDPDISSNQNTIMTIEEDEINLTIEQLRV